MKKYLLFLLLIIAVCGCSLRQTVRFDDPTVKKLDRFMSDSMKKYNSPGIILGAWVPGRGEYFRGAGLADVATKRPMPVDKIFRIGSLTKTFTGTVVLQLVDEGKLKLDGTIDKFFPWIPNSNKITIRQLLNMTAGIHSYSEMEEFGRILEADMLRPFKPIELVRFAISHKPDFEPGKGFYYSNSNTIVLGMIVEKVTGSTLEKEIKKRIIDRLGLNHTYFPTDEKMPELDYIHGYMQENGALKDFSIENPSWGWAAGAIISNLYDLKTYITALGDGTLLSKKLQEERFADGAPLPKERMEELGMTTLRYCLGAFKGGGFVGHNGSLPGYVNIAVYNPKNRAAIIIMLNRQSQGEATLEMFRDVYKILFPQDKI